MRENIFIFDFMAIKSYIREIKEGKKSEHKIKLEDEVAILFPPYMGNRINLKV